MDITRVCILSDTHGLLRPEAIAFLQGCQRIIHAGDIGNAGILQILADLAPLTAVRGNNDRGVWAEALPVTEHFQIGSFVFYLIHDRNEIDLDPVAAGIHVVISGHSHNPSLETRDGVLYLNPGAAGPRRFSLPVSVAELRINGASVEPRLVRLL